MIKHFISNKLVTQITHTVYILILTLMHAWMRTANKPLASPAMEKKNAFSSSWQDLSTPCAKIELNGWISKCVQRFLIFWGDLQTGLSSSRDQKMLTLKTFRHNNFTSQIYMYPGGSDAHDVFGQ